MNNKNKGVIGIGLIIAIVLGIAVVGGGAYYVGTKNDIKKDVEIKVEDKNIPQKNSEDSVEVVVDEKKEETVKPVVSNTYNSTGFLDPLTLIPNDYVRSNNGVWPPEIKTSATSYSCSPSKGYGDVPTVVEEKTIYNRKYCVTSYVEHAAGSSYGNYTYVTAFGNGTKTATFTLAFSGCGVYGGPNDPKYKECQSTQSKSLISLDILIDSLMQKNDVSTANWKTYKNTQYGIEFIYPSTAKITEKILGRTDLTQGIILQVNIPFVTNYDAWKSKVVDIIIRQSSCSDYLPNTNLEKKMINGISYLFQDPEWTATSGMSTVSKWRKYFYESSDKCYMVSETISGLGNNERPSGSTFPSDVDKFLTSELVDLDKIVASIKIF